MCGVANKQKCVAYFSGGIEYQREQAKWKLEGKIISYIKAHLSQTDPEFRKILEMKPSPDKRKKIDDAFVNIKNHACIEYYKKLSEYTEKVLSEFKERFDNRITEQEEQADQKVKELEKIMADAEAGMKDVDKVEDECAPAMEASQCIITVLNKAVI